ncbi:MAG: tetratricopeptide repeat protein [Bacteroidetes bacterium]|nr:tetratricopeptide repeat protein [Bacteroidota bacterium]
MKRFLFWLLFSLSAVFAISQEQKKISVQNTKLDSLYISLKSNNKETVKLELYNIIASIYYNNARYDSSIIYYNKCLLLSEKLNNKLKIANCILNIGLINYSRGDYPKALDYYTRALKIYEDIKEKAGIAKSYTNIGLIYDFQGSYSQALEYYTKALKIDEELKDKEGISADLLNIGTMYQTQKEYYKALQCYKRALKLNEELNDKDGISSCITNIGLIYDDQKDYEKALEYYYRSLKIDEELNNKEGIILSLVNISDLNITLKKYAIAKGYAQKVIALSKEINTLNNLRMGYEILANAEVGLGNYKEAYANHVKFKQLTDTIFNIENSSKLSNTKTNFEVEKKETELKAKAAVQKAISLEEKKRHQLIIYIIIGILLIIIIFTFALFKRFKLTNKQKDIIELKEKQTQNQLVIIDEQKRLVEAKHKEITDSIQYAERIQRSFLASNELLQKNLKEHFIFFQPKDVVSGDFYWSTEHNGNFYLAVSDSTGHGVPGAFMSLLNMFFLSEAIKEKGILVPNEILNHVRKRLIEHISQDGAQDGMDCILLCINTVDKKLTYSAANNAPILISNNKMIELPKDKMPVGKGERDTSFTLYEIKDIKREDTLYLYTDGYGDQFGGAEIKKFKSRQLNEFLLSVSQNPINKQRSILEDRFIEWKGVLDQIDDICIIGIKI